MNNVTCFDNGRDAPLVVELRPAQLVIRQLGCRRAFAAPYPLIYEDAARREAERVRREKARAKAEARKGTARSRG